MHEGPPLIPEWINKITCAKCKKKEYFSCNCPPKYNNKIRKMPQKKSSPSYNSVSKSTIQDEEAAHVNEFAGYTHQMSTKIRKDQT